MSSDTRKLSGYTKKKTLGLAMMVKTESARILVSIGSVIDIMDSIIIFDTGSTDDTVEKIKNFCNEKKVKCFVLEEKVNPLDFDFSENRNKCLKFADNKADYLLLLDSNDELKSPKEFREFIDNDTSEHPGFYALQSWWDGITLNEYYNVRIIKTGQKWEFKDPIHEYIICPKMKISMECIGKTPFVVYQDRTKDDDKSKNRFPRDKRWFIKLIKKEPNSARYNFYFAQTLLCLGEKYLAYRYYKNRTRIYDFIEEIYHSNFHCGSIGQSLGHSWESCLDFYLKAFSTMKPGRVEPILEIAKYYIEKKELKTAYSYMKMCIELPYPEKCMLFVNKRAYSYQRYHLMGKIVVDILEESDPSNMKEKLEIGKNVLEKAIKAENKPEDIELLKKIEDL